MTNILRGETGFMGVSVTDALSMDAISKSFGEIDAVKRVFKAGVDIALMPTTLRSAADEQKLVELIDALEADTEITDADYVVVISEAGSTINLNPDCVSGSSTYVSTRVVRAANEAGVPAAACDAAKALLACVTFAAANLGRASGFSQLSENLDRLLWGVSFARPPPAAPMTRRRPPTQRRRRRTCPSC